MKKKTHRDLSKLPSEAVLRLPDVLALVGLCRASVYAKVAEHRFPSPIKLTTHATGWRLSDIRAWLADPIGWSPASVASVSTSSSYCTSGNQKDDVKMDRGDLQPKELPRPLRAGGV